LSENLKGRDPVGKHTGVNGTIILKCILKKLDEGTDWIHLALQRQQYAWRLVNKI
jgi:hypothetical protein